MYQHRFGVYILLVAVLLCGRLKANIQVMDPTGPQRAQASLISESRDEIIVEIRLGIAEVDSLFAEGTTWTAISIPGMGQTSRSGWPELPQISMWLSVNGANSRVEILEQDVMRRYWGTARPAAEPLNRSGNGSPRRIAEAQFYEGIKVYPENVAEVSISGRLGGQRVALLTCTPVQYQPRTREWTISTRLRLRIVTQAESRLDQRPSSRLSQNIAAAVVLNPPAGLLDSGTPPARMLLVTMPSFVSVLQPYIEWKTQSGISVRTILFPGAATDALSLRAYIRALCDSLSPLPEFLLLVGDVNAIPAFFGVNSSLTDHPYSLLDDNDYLPDLSVGRIPCPTAVECGYWVQRLLAYERDISSTTNRMATVFSSAAALDPQHGIHVRSVFQSSGFSVNAFQEPETGTLSSLVASLNTSPQWVFYIGHGYSQGWSSVHPAFTNSDAGQLASQTAPIVISVACATADLDYPGMSIAESWLSRPPSRGPLAYFGATESTAFFRSDTLGIAALRAIFEQGCERLGPAADLGRLATAQSFPQGAGGLTEETIQQFILLGDPSMRVFSSAPHALNVTCPEILPLSADELRFSLQVSGAPLNGADVCVLSDPPGYYSLRQTTALGEAVFPIAFTSPLILQWTVTSHNGVPAMGVVHVVPDTGAFLQISSLRVLDPNGDGDGAADRSESCGLQLSLSNIGNSLSTGGTLTVSCSDQRALIRPFTIPFLPLDAREQRWIADTIPVAISSSVQDQDVVLLQIAVRTARDSLNAVRPLVLHAPRMVYQGSVLSEDSGDGDGQPEAAERLVLDLRFRNEGSEHLRFPLCSLLTVPPQVHVLLESSVDTVVVPGETFTSSVTLAAETNIPRGLALQYSYRLSASNSAPQTGWDVQRIGRIPVYLLVLDRAPQQVDAVAGALTALGVEYERGNTLPQDLFRYMSVWIFSGIYPNAAGMSFDYAGRLAQYLDGGGNCYWEGGDVWVFDPRNSLHPYFPIRGTNDGTSNAGPVSGEYGTAYADFHFGYAGENSFIDQIEPDNGGLVMLRNGHAGATYPVAIAYAASAYRTVGSSIELGSLVDGAFPSTRVHLFKKILDWFGIESRADIYPPTIQHVPETEFPLSNRPLPIFADIQDASGLDTAIIEYHHNNESAQTVPLSSETGLYRGQIPGAPFGTVVHYRILAVDASPAHNAFASEEFSVEIVAEPFTAFRETFARTNRMIISPLITGGEGSSWAITDYPEEIPVLELHGGSAGITYTTGEFDCSQLQNPGLSFWHYLRDMGGHSDALARVWGSVDGGQTFPHSVWQSSPTSGGVLEEGIVSIPDIGWMAGQDIVVLKFEFSGRWYWRLRDITIEGTTKPVTAPITRLVISVVPSGVKLMWPSVPGAFYYVVSASPVFSADAVFEPVTQTTDTVFVDVDDSFTSRYYQVEAVVEKGVVPPQNESAAIVSGQIRLPDLRWNLKLGNQNSR